MYPYKISYFLKTCLNSLLISRYLSPKCTLEHTDRSISFYRKAEVHLRRETKSCSRSVESFTSIDLHRKLAEISMESNVYFTKNNIYRIEYRMYRIKKLR